MAIKRGMVLVGCAAAVAFGSVLSASPAAAKECPWGTSPTRFEGVCSPGGPGGTGNGNQVVAPGSAGNGPNIVNKPNELTTVNGIPCTTQNWNKCYGIIQSQG